VAVTVPDAFSGTVIDKLSRRSGTLTRHEVDPQGNATLEFDIPSRGLIGYRSEFLTDTRGEGILYQTFSRYAPRAGQIRRRENGALIVQDPCETVAYALHNLQERGKLLLPAGHKVYAGQVIGLHSRANDLIVNPGKKKQLTNMRAAGTDDSLRLVPPVQLSLEETIELIADDELVEITPKTLRIRKRILDHNERKKEQRLRNL